MTRYTKVCAAILLVAALIRLLTLGAYPLADTTEARYGEIARLMVVSGDWISPQIEAGVPFWGKPPLSTWLTASSFTVFGVTEFAARLPAFLLVFGCVWLIASFGRSAIDPMAGNVAGVIVATSGIGFINAGAVMTDPALFFATTLAMISFWRAVVGSQPHWGYVFFMALGAGLLAKGPIAVILTLAPISIWVMWRRQWLAIGDRLPWKSGPIITLAIALPWYLLAELKTPGFLNYFIIGEHWSRYVESGWSGDLYGSAHSEAKGTIWLFWAASILPWSLFVVPVVRSQTLREKPTELTDWHSFLLLWAITPMVFFTMAGNILPSYVLPGLPAFALLLAQPIAASRSRIIHAGWIVPIIFLLLGPTVLYEQLSQRSHRDLVLRVQALGDVDNLVYVRQRPYSASFYSNGQASVVDSFDELESELDLPGQSLVVIKASQINAMPDRLVIRLSTVRAYSRYTLMMESNVNSRD